MSVVDVRKIFPIVKDIIVNKHFTKDDDRGVLLSYLQYYKILNEVLVEALSVKLALEEGKEINQFILVDLFSWYARYVKVYEILLNIEATINLSKKEKNKILKIIQDIDDSTDIEMVIEKIGIMVKKQVLCTTSM